MRKRKLESGGASIAGAPKVAKVHKGAAINKLDTATKSSLHIFNLNVGQGSGVLFVVTDNENPADSSAIRYSFLVDGGFSYNTAQISTLLGGQNVDAVCITHADADHKNCPVDLTDVEQYYLPYLPFPGAEGTKPVADSWTTLWTGADDEELRVHWHHVYDGRGRLIDGENSKSLAATVHWGKFSFYFDGDLDDQRQTGIQGKVGKVDCLYVTHHGSQKTLFAPFLTALAPAVTLISSGKNPHGHPEASLLQRLLALPKKPYIFLTNCHYNRREVNDVYWETERLNFVKWHAQTIANPPSDFWKIGTEYIGSLQATLDEAAAARGAALTGQQYYADVTGTVTAFKAALADDDQSWGSAEQAFALLTPTFFANLQALLTEAGKDAAVDAQVTVAGCATTQGPVVISMTGADPAQYGVCWAARFGLWHTRLFDIAGGRHAAEDFPVVHSVLYKRSYDARTKQLKFNTSNRFSRDAATPHPYKCAGCGNMINELGTEVFVHCNHGLCVKTKVWPYHAICVLNKLRKRIAANPAIIVQPGDVSRPLLPATHAKLTAFHTRVLAHKEALKLDAEAHMTALVCTVADDACHKVHMGATRASRNEVRIANELMKQKDAARMEKKKATEGVSKGRHRGAKPTSK